MTQHDLPEYGEPNAFIYIAPGDTVRNVPFLEEPHDRPAFLAFPAYECDNVAAWYARIGAMVTWCQEQGLSDPDIWNTAPRGNGDHRLPALWVNMPTDKAMLFKLTFGGA